MNGDSSPPPPPPLVGSSNSETDSNSTKTNEATAVEGVDSSSATNPSATNLAATNLATTNPAATKPTDAAPKKLSFSDVVSNGRAPPKSAHATVRKVTEKRICMEQDAPYPVRFVRVKGHYMAIPKTIPEISYQDLLRQLPITFPKMSQFGDMYEEDLCLGFDSAEDLEKALNTQLIVNNYVVPTFKALHSEGQQLRIRAHTMFGLTIAQRQEAIKSLFKTYGNVVHFQFFYMKGTNCLMPTVEFILDIPMSAPRDLVIPRIKFIGGHNVLFSWAGNPFCFRCGFSDHLKTECPRPLTYNVATDLPFHEPIMARAFPDLQALPRVDPSRAPETAPHPQSPKSPSEWKKQRQEQQREAKRDRAARNRANDSGSDRDSNHQTSGPINKRSKTDTETTKTPVTKLGKEAIATIATLKEHAKQETARLFLVTTQQEKTKNPGKKNNNTKNDDVINPANTPHNNTIENREAENGGLDEPNPTSGENVFLTGGAEVDIVAHNTPVDEHMLPPPPNDEPAEMDLDQGPSMLLITGGPDNVEHPAAESRPSETTSKDRGVLRHKVSAAKPVNPYAGKQKN